MNKFEYKRSTTACWFLGFFLIVCLLNREKMCKSERERYIARKMVESVVAAAATTVSQTIVTIKLALPWKNYTFIDFTISDEQLNNHEIEEMKLYMNRARKMNAILLLTSHLNNRRTICLLNYAFHLISFSLLFFSLFLMPKFMYSANIEPTFVSKLILNAKPTDRQFSQCFG